MTQKEQQKHMTCTKQKVKGMKTKDVSLSSELHFSMCACHPGAGAKLKTDTHRKDVNREWKHTNLNSPKKVHEEKVSCKSKKNKSGDITQKGTEKQGKISLDRRHDSERTSKTLDLHKTKAGRNENEGCAC